MRGEFPKIFICWIMGHEECVCDFCVQNGISICERCDADL